MADTNNNMAFITFSKPFIEAAKNVFETMVFTKIEAQKPSIKKSNLSKGDISAILGIAGKVTRDNQKYEYRGMLVISWPYPTFVKVASAMLMENYTEYTDAIADAGAEIANMIMGNAKRALGGMGYETSMAIPSIVSGQGHSLSYPAESTVILIPVVSAHGDFFMEICYQEVAV